MSDRPISDYALLADCQTAALAGRDGSVDWLCLPHFDSRAVLGRLLDKDAGHWSLRPSAPFTVRRAYLADTMVLRTEFRTATGTVALTEALAAGPNERGHELGTHAPHVLLRALDCTDGRVEIEAEFAPRPEYGLIRPLLIPEDGHVRCHGGPDTLDLSTPVPFSVAGGDMARARFPLCAGQRAAFALQHAPAGRSPSAWTQAEIMEQLHGTIDSWRSWSALHQSYEGPWRELVHLSGRVLQGLTFQPTGAVVAAPTTSLPEEPGGVRNWDYRYAWVRDASFTLDALWVAACPDEAEAFFRWMAHAAAQAPDRRLDLQIMFGIRGERDLSERRLAHLSGWRGSSPVRIGNAAWSQRQLDVYGELLSAAHRLCDYLGGLDGPARAFLAGLADAAAERWREPDQGIWEVRSAPQHFVYSKLMCWVALDRAVALAGELDAAHRVPDWERTREEIRAAIEEHGWSEAAGSYTQAFGSDVLDASVLMMPIVGFTDANAPRMTATIRAIRERLMDPAGLVHRYQDAEDGLPGGEGAFLLCTFWLAHALAMAGELARAREVFDRAVGCANDVGLLAEEFDTAAGEPMGNFPQAFSHIGLVNAAWAISRAEQGDTRTFAAGQARPQPGGCFRFGEAAAVPRNR
ncbi:glycoside hydrolase family 15 protein [Streptomyces sp. GC420]|uniref:glycoside hydrolase family 15 protein n=1 Tax=Streptomyces sp. GC420 TaxID=2697568 RepID=UPI001414F619|nr:glycoside hydrolase family 15 protein [Streptomyces sp. GC420]NBM14716.1 glycoside hydrolase family 15 protein [Streptomyces sp. GC420]